MIGVLRGRVSRLEVLAAGAALLILGALVVIEPAILEAPFQSSRTVAFTFGGTAIAAVAFVGLLALRVPAPVRLVVLGAPFVVVNAWLLTPFFEDDVVDEGFVASIDGAPRAGVVADGPDGATTASPPGPVLVGSGSLRGLAGHRGSGEAGVFRDPAGVLTLRLELLDIQNGPDLELYLVPGAEQRSPAARSIHLGPLRGNVGNLTYELPAGTTLDPGPWTVLIWCKAFSVEFTAATLTVT